MGKTIGTGGRTHAEIRTNPHVPHGMRCHLPPYFDTLEVVSTDELRQRIHTTSAHQRAMMPVDEAADVPTNKSVHQALDGKVLGNVLVQGCRVRTPPDFVAKLVQLTLHTLHRRSATKR